MRFPFDSENGGVINLLATRHYNPEDCPLHSYGFEEVVPYLRPLVAGFPPRRLGFEPRSLHVGFVMEKVTLEQVFSEYFGFP
jgi:hypothetical protein